MGNIHVKDTIKVVMIGLTGSGKTHFLFTINYGDNSGASIKTMGYNQERLVHSGRILHFVDIGASIPNTKEGKFIEIPGPIMDQLLANAGCLYFFVDGEDDKESLLIAKSQLLELITSKEFNGVPVAVIQNVRPDVRLSHALKKKRRWEDFKKGMEIDRLSSFVKVFVTDLSYTDGKPVKALLDFTAKNGLVH